MYNRSSTSRGSRWIGEGPLRAHDPLLPPIGPDDTPRQLALALACAVEVRTGILTNALHLDLALGTLPTLGLGGVHAIDLDGIAFASVPILEVEGSRYAIGHLAFDVLLLAKGLDPSRSVGTGHEFGRQGVRGEDALAVLGLVSLGTGAVAVLAVDVPPVGTVRLLRRSADVARVGIRVAHEGVSLAVAHAGGTFAFDSVAGNHLALTGAFEAIVGVPLRALGQLDEVSVVLAVGLDHRGRRRGQCQCRHKSELGFSVHCWSTVKILSDR